MNRLSERYYFNHDDASFINTDGNILSGLSRCFSEQAVIYTDSRRFSLYKSNIRYDGLKTNSVIEKNTKNDYDLNNLIDCARANQHLPYVEEGRERS